LGGGSFSKDCGWFKIDEKKSNKNKSKVITIQQEILKRDFLLKKETFGNK
jgi:hypothetical protein